MKKFSKLNESVNIDIDKVNLLLSKLEGFEYKIFDYYYHINKSLIKLYTDEKDLIEDSYYSTLIVIKNTEIPKNWSNSIEGWNDKLGFNSSGFDFCDFDNAKKLGNYILV